MMEPVLHVSHDIHVKPLDLSYEHYLDRSAILYGATDSGKSTVLMEILNILTNKIPVAFVFSPTADENETFRGTIPNSMIYPTVEIKTLEEIYNRQKGSTKTYNIVNNLVSLRKLFVRVADRDMLIAEEEAIKNAQSIIKRKERDMNISHSGRKSLIAEVKKLKDSYLNKLYKHVIRSSKKIFRRMNLKESEKFIIKFLDFNPHCVIILDDCGAELKKFQNSEVLKKIFMQGRHNHITLILTLQDDKGLDTSIKKNAFVSIFTEIRCASAFFDRSSSSFNKSERIEAEKIVSFVLDKRYKKTYRKLYYMRDSPDPFRYRISNIYEPFAFGCPKVWKYCARMTNGGGPCDIENDPLLTPFRINM